MSGENEIEGSAGTTDPSELLAQALDMVEELGENEGSYSDDGDDEDEGEVPSDSDTGVLDEEPADAGEDSEGHADSGLAADNLGQTEGASPNVDPREWAEFQQFRQAQQHAAYQRQHGQYQDQLRSQQQPQSRQQAQQRAGFEWKPPHDMTHDVRTAMSLRGTESYAKLPDQQRQRAEETHDYVQNNWDRWTFNPGQLVDDLVLPRIAPVIQQVVDRMAELQAAEFARRNPDLAEKQNASRYLEIVQQATQDPYKVGLEVMRMQRALEEARGTAQGTKTRSRDQQAASKGARGKPAHKGRSKPRRGKRKREIKKEDRANPSKIAEAVMRDMIEQGEISPSDF